MASTTVAPAAVATAKDLLGVVIANTAAEPVPVTSVDARPVPVHGSEAWDLITGQGDRCIPIYSVPEGKRLAIEYVDALVYLSSDSPVDMEIESQASPRILHSWPLTPVPAQNYFKHYGAEVVQIFVEAGGQAKVCVDRDDNSFAGHASVQWSGHLDDA